MQIEPIANKVKSNEISIEEAIKSAYLTALDELSYALIKKSVKLSSESLVHSINKNTNNISLIQHVTDSLKKSIE